MKLLKSIIAIILVSVSFTAVHAQEALNKGVYSIGGSIQYSSVTQSNDFGSYTQNTGVISPQFTYFVINHLAVGAMINYNYFYGSEPGGNEGNVNVRNSYITIGAAVRYYFYVKHVVPFVEASFNYGVYDMQFQTSENSYNIGVKGGFEIFLSGSVSLEPFISYNYIKYRTSVDEFIINQKNNNVAFGVGMNYFIF